MLLKITGFYSCFCTKVSTQYKENPFNLTKYAIWWFLPSPFSVLGCKKRCDLNKESDTYCIRPMLTEILKMKWEWKVHQVHWAFQVFPLRYEVCYSLGCCEAKSINICKVLVCNLVNIHKKSTWEQIILTMFEQHAMKSLLNLNSHSLNITEELLVSEFHYFV